MPIPLLALPLLASVFGGGDETNVTNTSASNIQFNPSIAVSLGGGVNSTPSGSFTSTPTATTTSNDTEGGGFGGFGGGGTLPISGGDISGGGVSSFAKIGLAIAAVGAVYYFWKAK